MSTKTPNTNSFFLQAFRGGSRAAATSKMGRFIIIVNGWRPLTIITKRSILDAAAALDPPLALVIFTSNSKIPCSDEVLI